MYFSPTLQHRVCAMTAPGLPLYADRLDMPEAYQAADRLARLFVASKLEWPDVRHYAKRWARMAHQVTGVDAHGAEARFCWAAGDAVTQAERERAEVVRAIKATLRPLIEARQASNRLYAEAHNTNADHDFALSEDDVDDIVTVEMSWAIKKADRNAR